MVVMRAWLGAVEPGVVSRSMERSHQDSGVSKLLQIKQLNDTSQVLLLFFISNLTNVPKLKRSGC